MQAIKTTAFSVSSSNEPILSVEAVESTVSADSDFLEPTEDPVPEDESCSGLAEIQVCAINFFLVHSNIVSSVPTGIRVLDYTVLDESPEDDLDPLVDNPDPSFDCDNPHDHQLTKWLPRNSIIPSQHPIAPYNPDTIRGQFDTSADVSCTNLKYLIHNITTSPSLQTSFHLFG